MVDWEHADDFPDGGEEGVEVVRGELGLSLMIGIRRALDYCWRSDMAGE
jgi:hypothetical protein